MRRSTSTATGWPAPSGGCRCKIFGMEEGPGVDAGPSPRPRPAADQHPARPRRGRRDRPALSAARSAGRRRHRDPRPEGGDRRSAHRRGLPLGGRPRRTSTTQPADAVLSREPAGPHPRAAADGRGLLGRSCARRKPRAGRRRAAACQPRQGARCSGSCCGTASWTDERRGLRGRRRARRAVGGRAPGRARRARSTVLRGAPARPAGAAAPISTPTLGMTIDNGNHLVLSGNHAAHDYLRTHRRARTALAGPTEAEFDFCDVRDGRALDACGPTTGRSPGGCSSKAAACPAPTPPTTCALLTLLRPQGGPAARRGDRLQGPLWERLMRAVAAGGAEHRRRPRARPRWPARWCARPWRAAAAPTRRASPIRPSPPPSSILPSPSWPRHGAEVRTRPAGRRRSRRTARARSALSVGGETIAARRRRRGDRLAMPPWVTPGAGAGLIGARRIPRHRQRAFQDRAAAGRAADGRRDRRRRRSGCSPSTDRISVTVSGADAIVDMPREETGGGALGRRRQGLRPRRADAALADRQGAARHLRRHAGPGRQAARGRAPAGATLRWPATGPRPACPPPSRARCAPATRRPSSSWR